MCCVQIKPKFDTTPLGHENMNRHEVPASSAITVNSKEIKTLQQQHDIYV